MQRFPMAHADGADWRVLCSACLEQLGRSEGHSNLGFLYVTTALARHLGDILALLKQTTGVTHWIGSVGVGINCTGQEYYETPAMVAMLGVFPEDGFRIVPGLHHDLEAFIGIHRLWYQQHRYHYGVLHADPRNPAVTGLLAQLAREVPGTCFVGGLTSSNGHYLQVADTLTEGGLSGVLFAPKVRVTTGLTQGCVPVGPQHRISACDLNIIHRLDDRPALDVLYEEIGEILARDPRRIAGYIFAGLPIADGESDGEDYVVRNLLGLDLRSKRIAIGEHVNTGQTLLFCRRDGNSARDDLVRMARDLRRQLPGPPKGGLYYSCLGRGRHLFGPDSQELRLIRAELGDIPLVGFFANGEISRNRLYGYTGVLTLFS